jgi:hypothetical protein
VRRRQTRTPLLGSVSRQDQAKIVRARRQGPKSKTRLSAIRTPVLVANLSRCALILSARSPVKCGLASLRFPSRPAPLVGGPLRRAHRGPIRRLERHPARRAHAHRRAHGLRQDAGRLPHLDRPALPRGRRARRAAGRGAGHLCLAAKGALGRHPQEPRRAAARDPCARRGDGPARGEDHGGGAQRRHAAERARRDVAHAAAHPRHHSRVALPAAHRGAFAQHAAQRARRDRRRDPRGAAVAPRGASRAHARAPRPRLRAQAPADRAIGDAETDRGSGEVPGWRLDSRRLGNDRRLGDDAVYDPRSRR